MSETKIGRPYGPHVKLAGPNLGVVDAAWARQYPTDTHPFLVQGADPYWGEVHRTLADALEAVSYYAIVEGDARVVRR